MIRYRGTSPKLGGSQGECPYPILNFPFDGEGNDGGDEGEIFYLEELEEAMVDGICQKTTRKKRTEDFSAIR